MLYGGGQPPTKSVPPTLGILKMFDDKRAAGYKL